MENKLKYILVKDYILQLINRESIKPHEKLYSENQFAKKLNVSRQTVRQAIKELTNGNILYTMQGKGTFVAGLNNGHKMIAVVTTYMNDYIFPSIIQGVDEVLSNNGFNYILNCTLNNHEKERKVLLNLLDQNIQGLIIEPTQSAIENPNIHLYNKLAEKGVEIIFIHGYYKRFKSMCIRQDDEKGGYLATEFLLKNGHSKFGGIFKYDDMQGRLRYTGFKKALQYNNIPLDKSDVIWTKQKDFNKNELNHFISVHDGIVVYNEQIAVLVMDIIRKNNLRIPDDISIISFDDSYIALASEPKLTTISHPKKELGILAAEKILFMIENKGTDLEDIIIRPELIVRHSVRHLSTPNYIQSRTFCK